MQPAARPNEFVCRGWRYLSACLLLVLATGCTSVPRMDVAGRQVFLLGHRHTHPFLFDKQPDNSAPALIRLVEKNQADVDRQRRDVDKLDALLADPKACIGIIGIEACEADLAEVRTDIFRTRRLALKLFARQPEQTRYRLADDLMILAYGPVLFMTQSPLYSPLLEGVDVIGVDDCRLHQEALDLAHRLIVAVRACERQFDKPASFGDRLRTFTFRRRCFEANDDGRFSARERDGMRKVANRFEDPASRAAALAMVRAEEQMQQSIDSRDQAFAKAIIAALRARRGNLVIVVGQAHVAGIRRCLREEAATTPTL